MSIAGVLRRLQVSMSGDTRRPLPRTFVEPLQGARALELGGPSACFQPGGVLPVYPLLELIDGVQPHAVTEWHELDPSKGNVVAGTRRGDLRISDDLALPEIPDGAYDVVLCSHVIEHIANPLRALRAWRRVTGPGRRLLMVVPHMEGTFDHRRPVTPLAHMVEDLETGTAEDDLTHLDEFLELHDASRNIRGQDDPEFVAELRDNATTRLLHHHTFTTCSLLELLTHAGLQVDALETRLPHDIFVLGHWLPEGESTENRRFMVEARHSPFTSDRRAAAAVARGGA